MALNSPKPILPALLLAVLAWAPPAQAQEVKRTLASLPGAVADSLPPGAVAQFGSLRLHDFTIDRTLAFSRDSKYLATSGSNRPICVWEAATGKLMRTHLNHTSVIDLRWQDNGTLAVLTYFGSEAFFMEEFMPGKDSDPKAWERLYKEETMGEISEAAAKKKKARMDRAFLSTDGAWVIASWTDTETSRRFVERYKFTSAKTSNTAPAESRIDLPGSDGVWPRCDGNLLLAHVSPADNQADKLVAYRFGGAKGKAKPVWELTFPGREEARPAAVVCFGRDSRRVVVMFGDNTVELWDGPTGKRLRELAKVSSFYHHGNWEYADMDVAPDGKHLALVYRGSSGDVGGQILDVDTGKILTSLTPQPLPRCPGFGGTRFSPDGKQVARLSYGVARLWNTETGADACPLPGHRGRVRSLLCAPDGRTAVSSGEDLTVRAWDVSTGQERWHIVFPQVMIVKFITKDAVVVADADDYRSGDTPRFQIDLTTGKTRPLPGTLGVAAENLPLALFPDGTRVLTINFKKPAFRIWSWPAGELLSTVPLTPPGAFRLTWCGPAHFTPDGKQLVMIMHYMDPAEQLAIRQAPDRQRVERWDLTAGKLLERSEPKSAQSPLLIPHRAGMYRWMHNDEIHDALTGHLAVKLHCPEGQSYDILAWTSRAALSPDRRVLALGADGAIHLYEKRLGRVRETLHSPGKGSLTSLQFLPDGRLVSAADTAVVWSIGLRPIAVPLANRDLSAWWQQLGDRNPQTAWPAMGKLAGASGQAVALIRKNVHQLPKLNNAELDRILRNLGSDVFKTRESAAIELDKLGRPAVPGMRDRIAKGVSLEVRRRVMVFLAKLDTPELLPDDLRALRAVEVLEAIATPDARDILRELAAGEPSASLTQEAATTVQSRRPD